MKGLEKILEYIIRVSKKSRTWRTSVFCLAAIVVFTTTYSLILPAITVEKSATENVGGLVMEEADPGSTGAEAEAPGEVMTADAENETPDETLQEEVPDASSQTPSSENDSSENGTAQPASSQTETAQAAESTAAVDEEVKEPVNGEVRTIGDRRIMTLRGEDFDVVVSGDLSVGVSDGTVLSVRGISDADVVRSFSDRISDELVKIFVDTKTTEVLYQLVFTDKDLVEYSPAGNFDVQFIFHNNTVSHTGEMVYAAVYDYLTDEMILAEKNSDVYKTPVISLNEYGIITGITLKGLNFGEYSDIITLVAGPVNEERKLTAEQVADSAETDRRNESSAESAESDSRTESGTGSADSDGKTESSSESAKSETEKTESTGTKADSADSRSEGPSAKAKTSKESKKAENGTLTARGSDYTVTLTYSAEAKIPGNAVLEVTEIKSGTSAYEKYLEQAKAAMGLDEDRVLPKELARFFDIRIMADGKEVQPAANVSVNITYDQPVAEADPGTEAQIDASAVHFGKEGAEVVEVSDSDASRVEFEAESFSVYGIIYTVDFEYSVNGKMYQFSLPGGEKIALSDLIEVLGIIGDTNFDTVDEFIAAVETVEFSDSSLVAVSKVEKDTTFSAIEEDAYRSLGDNWMDATINGTSDPVIDDETIMAGDWLLTSLSPFTSEEELHIYTNDKVEHIINVSDEQHNVSNGEWAFEHKDSGEEGDYDVNNGTLDASLSRTVTSTPQERNVTFTMSLDYNLTSEAVAAIKDFHDGYPVLTYDLTEWLEQKPVDLSDTSGRLRAGNTTVGTYTVENGIVKLKITNLQWLHTQNRLDGTFTLKLTVNEEKLGTDDEWKFQLPNTDEPFKITFKEQEYKTTKTYQINGDDAWDGAKIEKDEDGNYYINYTATINSPSKMDSLQFIDTLSSNQELVGNVTVTSPTGQNLTTTKNTTSTGFTVDISTTDDSGKLSAGTYTVSYRTKLTDEAVQQLESGNYTTDDPVTNNSDWKINGTKEIDGPSTELQPKKDPPQPDPPAKTVNGKNGDVGKFTYGQTLNYTLTYGSERISLNGTTISDTMSTLQNLVGDVTITYGDGTTATMPTAAHGYDNGQGVVWNSADQPQFTGYAEGEKNLFSYTFTEDKEGPVTISYSTQVLSESDAESMNLFGTKDIRNTFVANGQSSWTVGHVDTQEPTQISKTIANKNGSSSYNPGDTVTYTVEYGKAGQNMSGITLLDSMTDIQELTGGITITFGDGSTVTLNSGDTGYVWNNDGTYSTGNTDVLNYTVGDGKTGIITVTYDAKIISEEQGNKIGLWGTQPLNNHASSSKGGSADTHKDIDFGQKPEPEVHKTANNLTTSSGNWQPGDEIEWTITYTNDEKDMNGMVLEDYMNYLQTYVKDSAKISINGGAAVDMPASYITYNTEGKTYGKDTQIQVYHFVVNESEAVHSVIITYKTKIIDGDDALANYVSGTLYVYNRAIGEDEHDDDGHDTEFPTIPVDKEVTGTNGTESIDGEQWVVGQTVKFTMTYGAAGMQMNNAWIYDQMTDLFSSIGKITISYYNENGTELFFVMPESDVKFSNDEIYGINNKVDVFNYNIPGEDSVYGKIYGPLTISYEATLINQETATEKGIGGIAAVSNDFRTNVGADTVTGLVPYNSNTHDPTIEKTGYVNESDGNPYYGEAIPTSIPDGVEQNVSIADHEVTWYIRVSAAEGSSYPLSNFKVRETGELNTWQDISVGTGQNHYTKITQLIDRGYAHPEQVTIKTDSGTVLTPGVDYTYNSSDYSWNFIEINEPITIEFPVQFPYELVGNYEMGNRVCLQWGYERKYADSTVKGNISDVVVNKTGEYDPENRIITWTVILNPMNRTYEPDISKVLFKDDLPDGLTLVDYDNPASSDNPSIFVRYLGNTCWGNYNKKIEVEVTNGHLEADVTPYTTTFVPVVGINGQKYEIIYKTRIDDDEWAEITSSETGSKTYENSALFTDDETTSWSGTGEETVYTQNPLDKFEIQENTDGSDWYKINEIEGGTEDTERFYWYQLEINPDAEQLNHKNQDGTLNPLKLTDYIDTKIDIVPSTIQIMEVSGDTESDTNNDSDKPVATYNDDSRLLVITNLHDKTHYRIRYQVRVRALYTTDMDDPSSDSYHEYIISNTATLEGGGSWSDTTTGTHKAQEDGASISGGIQLTKIDENDVTKTLDGAVFELYKVDTGVVVETDSNGTVTNIDYSGVKDIPDVEKVLDYKRNSVGEIIGTDNDGDDSNETYTSKNGGDVDFGKNLEANTLYYWIETKFPEGYLGDTGTPHYFVIYYEEEQQDGSVSSGIHHAWELDDFWSAKYGITIASISGGTTWVANNSKTRSISITKRWSGDYNNTYKTRPESVEVNLIQIDEDGNHTVYDSTTLRADNEGNWLAYTNFAWTNLPATYDDGGETKYYTYTVEEENVSGYFATYSETEPITSGSITITNTLRPSKTNIFAEKVWEGDSEEERPNYIEAQLMQILTDSDGNKGTPTAYGLPVKLMLGTDGKWTYSWTDLPTKDGNGGTYTYTIQEVDVLEGYDVKYSDNGEGVLQSTDSNPLTITNTGLGSLKVSKTLQGLEFKDLTTAQKKAITFTVVDQSGKTVASFTLNDMGASLEKTIDNLPTGTYTITETAPDESVPVEYYHTSVTYNVDGGVTTVVQGQTAEVTVTNTYEKKTGSLKITKNVTANNQTVTDDSMDGTYNFKITDSAGNKLKFVYVQDEACYMLSNESTENLPEISIEITNGASNTIEVKGLAPGQYTVTEVLHSSTNITPNQESVTVTVEAGKTGEEVQSTAIAEITNNIETFEGYALPSTGGPGTRLFTILGSILVMFVGIMLWRRRRLI